MATYTQTQAFRDSMPPPGMGSTPESILAYLYAKDPLPIMNNPRLIRTFGKELPLPTKPHQFITVALPTEKTELQKLKKTIDNIRYKYMDNAFLTVEMFSGQLKKENLHIHILKNGIYNKTKLIRDMSRKFNVAVNFVNVKKSTKLTDYENRLAYLKGEKSDELKKENCELDKKWREDNGFRQIYNL